jgi:(E)-4-hydroxy-3-methylbut-2-enyl-diphosphate synthase
MVESALEFLDVCEDEGFYDLLFSMKASNARVAIHAYRLLVARLAERAGGAPSYPLHLGVTEAGDGEDGRIKSAIGIGALLEDGIGDTLRVSLTEDSVKEIPVAEALARRAEARWAEGAEAPDPAIELNVGFVPDPYSHSRRRTKPVSLGGLAVGGGEPVRVELDLGEVPDDAAGAAARLATSLAGLPGVECEGLLVHAEDSAALERVSAFAAALRELGLERPLALSVPHEQVSQVPAEAARVVLPVRPGDPVELLAACSSELARSGHPLEWCLAGPLAILPDLVDRALRAASEGGATGFVLSVDSLPAVHATRILASRLRARGAGDVPVLLCHRLSGDELTGLISAAVDLGALLCDGIGDALRLSGFAEPASAVDLAYRILQGARLRTTRTEYISCPSCGRTLFDLEMTTARIKAKTGHLKGVRIAVMGCIVNGPGEMADADFGYVGSGPGQVTLYIGKEIVARNLPEDQAPDRLVELIRERGRWIEGSESGGAQRSGGTETPA